MKKLTLKEFMNDKKAKYWYNGMYYSKQGYPDDAIPVRVLKNKIEIYKLVIEKYGNEEFYFFEKVKETKI